MNTKQTKATIIKSIHDKLGKDRKDIHMIIYEFFDEMKDGLGKVRQRNSVASEHSRSGYAKEKVRTPKTGETVSVDKHGVAVVIREGTER